MVNFSIHTPKHFFSREQKMISTFRWWSKRINGFVIWYENFRNFISFGPVVSRGASVFLNSYWRLWYWLLWGVNRSLLTAIWSENNCIKFDRAFSPQGSHLSTGCLKIKRKDILYNIFRMNHDLFMYLKYEIYRKFESNLLSTFIV